MKGGRHACLVVRLLLLALCCSASRVRGELSEGLLFADYPAVRVVRYPVFGDSLQAVQSSMRAHGPVDDQHRRRDGYSHWHIRWSWSTAVDGSPRFETAQATLTVTVTLPDWRDREKASPELQKAWEAYFRALVAHERKHLEIVHREFPEIELSLHRLALSQPSASAQKGHEVGEKVLRTIRMLDAELDLQTNHGMNEEVCLLPPCGSSPLPAATEPTADAS